MATYKKPCDMNEKEFKEHLQTKFMEFEKKPPSESGSSASPLKENDSNGDKYSFHYPKRGLALIFNVENFIDGEKRDGSAQDEFELCDALRRCLSFDVCVFHDLTADQIRLTAKEAAKLDGHQVSDCFVCVLLSHGKEKRKPTKSSDVEEVEYFLLGYDNKGVCTKEIVASFNDTNCQGLKNKPRLFFIQACRGEKFDSGVGENYVAPDKTMDVVNRQWESWGAFVRSMKGNKVEKIQLRPVPLYKDSLIMYATPPGYSAPRNCCNGSKFIIELCEFLRGKDVKCNSFINGLTTVNRKVSLQKKKPKNNKKMEPEEKELKVQMSVVDTMLTKDIIMTRKKANTSPEAQSVISLKDQN